jgi:hypothetical protein
MNAVARNRVSNQVRDRPRICFPPCVTASRVDAPPGDAGGDCKVAIVVVLWSPGPSGGTAAMTVCWTAAIPHRIGTLRLWSVAMISRRSRLAGLQAKGQMPAGAGLWHGAPRQCRAATPSARGTPHVSGTLAHDPKQTLLCDRGRPSPACSSMSPSAQLHFSECLPCRRLSMLPERDAIVGCRGM